MKTKLIGLLAIAFVITASALTVSAQLDDLPKLPHKKPEPGARPDLTVASALFRNTTVDVVIRNIGKAPSKPTTVAMEFYATLDPASKVLWTTNQNVPPLDPGKQFKTQLGTSQQTVTFNGHARRIIIDPYNTSGDTNRRNNQLFSNATPEADEGAFPSGALFDLTFTKVKFISPTTVDFCVKNLGSAASGGYQVRTTIYNGAKKDSGVYKSSTTPFPSLSAKEQQCFNFSFATYSNEEVFVNRSRFIEILSSGTEANSGNNSYFEPAAQQPWNPSGPQ